jgi:PqqD family protein of HPr-rel-A system
MTDLGAMLPAGRITVPDDVVRRAFGEETVLLHLETGQYHGLNATAARMLDLLEESGDAAATARAMADEFDVGLDVVAADLAELCEKLRERGLITVEG